MLGNILLPIGLALLLASIALGLLWHNERRSQELRLLREHQRALGLPDGDLVYEDIDGEGEQLTSTAYPLAGKPDYVVQLPDGRPVPVELKPDVYNANAPYSHHEVQIAAYCLILEDYFEQPPTHGILRYADSEFVVEYTPALRKKVVRLLTEMGKCSEQHPPPLTKQRPIKCRACTFQPICPVGRNK